MNDKRVSKSVEVNHPTITATRAKREVKIFLGKKNYNKRLSKSQTLPSPLDNIVVVRFQYYDSLWSGKSGIQDFLLEHIEPTDSLVITEVTGEGWFDFGDQPEMVRQVCSNEAIFFNKTEGEDD